MSFQGGLNIPIAFLGSLGVSGWCCTTDKFITDSRWLVSFSPCQFYVLAFPDEEWTHGISSSFFLTLSIESWLQLHFP